MKKIKKYFKKIRCGHSNASVVRWCIKHILDSEPSCVIVEYQCDSCGEYLYVYLKGEEKSQWILAMGDYKRENFNSTR